MKRKTKLIVLLFIFFLVPLIVGAEQADPHHNDDALVIVRDGQAEAVIIVPEHTDEQVSKAANTLVEYVEKSTDVVLPIMTTQQLEDEFNIVDGQVRIYVGHRAPGIETHIGAKLEDLDPYGFLIYPYENTITIIGPTVWGTLNGAHDFLERYVGVRWLMPGPDGEDVPQLMEVLVNNEEIRVEPVFKNRTIAPVYSAPDLEFALRNKLHNSYDFGIEFHHNIYTLFPPEVYGETNPEFYPGGNPPEPGNTHRWQPCFSVEETVDVAVSGILDYFANNPDASSFSLGVNDIGGYCEQDPSHPDYPGRTNSQGYVDMSDIFYAWVNEVVEQVLEVYPDKWFGLLAYREIVDPPSFPLHPRVVPFMTKDRVAWMDDEIREGDHQVIEEWNEVANQVAFYDYMYGNHYVVPRVFPHLMADNFQYAQEQGVYGYYIEMYHNAGDGPKAWLASRLLWDPEQDVDELLQEWYERTVGPEAASDLAAVFELWEQFWMERVKGSTWFERGKESTYLTFGDQSYLHLVTDEDIEESMQLIESVVAKAETEQQKTRAELIQLMFEYYEATVYSYARQLPAPADEAAALDLLENTDVDWRIQLVQKRRDLRDKFEHNPALKWTSSRWYEWSGWNGFEFWPIINYMKEHEPTGGRVTNKVREMTLHSDSANVRNFAQFLENIHLDQISSLTENSSFEQGDNDSPPWRFWNPDRTANIQRVEGMAHSGNSSILIEGAEGRAGTYQTFDIEPGLTAAQVHYYTPPGTESEGGVRIVMSMLDANGREIGSEGGEVISPLIPLSDTAGEWASIGLLEDIPTQVRGTEVKGILVNAQVFNAPEAQVYLDDVVVYDHEFEDQSHPDSNRTTFTTNSSFEEGAKSAPPWHFHISSTSSGTIERVEGFARTGEASVLIDQVRNGSVSSGFLVDPGLTAAQVYYYTPDGTGEGEIKLSIYLRDAQYGRLATIESPRIQLSDSAGKWTSIENIIEIPEMIDGVEVARAEVEAIVYNAQNTQVYMDDFVVYQGELSSDNLKSLVQLFAETGQFDNAQAARALTVHLTAIELFKHSAEKFVQHMEGFNRLVEHQKTEGLISERAYNVLKADADVLLAKWKE